MFATVHASAVLVGARAVLIRGPSNSGKSRLALELIEAARCNALRFARLVADDRAYLDVAGGRVLVRPAEALAGMLEIRGIGLRKLDYEPCAVVGWVADLEAADAERMPEAAANTLKSLVLSCRDSPSQRARRPCRRCSPSSLQARLSALIAVKIRTLALPAGGLEIG